MHADEVVADETTVRRLLAEQHPRWSHLPLRRVPSSGTVHVLYRLGDDMVVRLPRIHGALGEAELERTWLPRLGPSLPLAVPEPLAAGEPGAGYPWPWSVYRWLEGREAGPDTLALPAAAADLADFGRALRAVDGTGGPQPGDRNNWRGASLDVRDASYREALAQLAGDLDVAAAERVWDEALAAGPWIGPPVWVHGDLMPANLLAVDGRLTAVIDWGCLAVGDPACDFYPAWGLLDDVGRAALRERAGLDEATWVRGRGFALSQAVIALPYYRDTNPGAVAQARRTAAAALHG